MNQTMCVVTLLLAAMPVPSPQQAQRILRLENKLLSPCCYTQAVAIHPSDVAVEMRDEIVGMFLAGQTDKEIVDHYKALYGERILIEPEGDTRTVLYSLPFTSAISGLLVIALFLQRCLPKKRGKMATASAIGSEKLEVYRQKVRIALRDEDGTGLE